ncbi:hypothetical protein E8E12_002310 [Didymella heteroderae]|uniref:F-box domain-containing protein n=1 Tax=Didymella heteroderae TaxID=1769908 RepID=A0A9P4WIY5_9PLEO|nr:hypothetical protein E8E12_002310 [Didymella heteroderae]
MNKLNSLPQELIDIICETLTREDVIALRHTGRQLAKRTQAKFNNAFESLIVTCSKAGLERLEKFVSDPHCKYFVSKVKNVTIFTLTPYRLKELAESLASEMIKDDAYLQAYTYVRKTLANSLNVLPNLQTVNITDLPFRGIIGPPIQWNADSMIPSKEQTLFDPLQAAFTIRQSPLSEQQLQAERVENLLRAVGRASISPAGSQVCGLETVLSIFYDLDARDSIEVNLVTNLSRGGFPLIRQLDYLRFITPFAPGIRANCEQMFGRSNFEDSIIHKQFQLILTVVGDPRVSDEDILLGLFGIYQMNADAPTALRSLTLEEIPRNDLRNILVPFLV